MAKSSVVSYDTHRNGSTGIPFAVAIIDHENSDGERQRMLTIQFHNSDGAPTYELTATVDLDLAAAGEIRFGYNSWRCESFAPLMIDAHVDRQAFDALK